MRTSQSGNGILSFKVKCGSRWFCPSGKLIKLVHQQMSRGPTHHCCSGPGGWEGKSRVVGGVGFQACESLTSVHVTGVDLGN